MKYFALTTFLVFQILALNSYATPKLYFELTVSEPKTKRVIAVLEATKAEGEAFFEALLERTHAYDVEFKDIPHSCYQYQASWFMVQLTSLAAAKLRQKAAHLYLSKNTNDRKKALQNESDAVLLEELSRINMPDVRTSSKECGTKLNELEAKALQVPTQTKEPSAPVAI